MTTRSLQQVIRAMAASDGAGVKLKRSIGQSPAARLDPFLMLDEFGTENPDDYIAGFPDHPHRGFETVTYMLDGHMLHQDHLGNRGDLKSGDVQGMTAVTLPGGGRGKVIAGTLEAGGRATPGPMQGLSTAPLYFDVELQAGESFAHGTPIGQ